MLNIAYKDISKSDYTLYIDIGNTAIKVSYQEEGRWKKPIVFSHEKRLDFLEWLSDTRHHFEHFVIASVVEKVKNGIVRGLGSSKNILLTTELLPAKRLNYETVDTLGIDRFLACFGAHKVIEKAVVVIDSGSACTIDYMNHAGVFQGGVIMPGLAAFEQGLKHYAPKLPEVERDIPQRWPGKTTRESIQWGITGTFINGVTAVLERYSEKMGEFELFLTGGDASWIEERINQQTKRDPHLVFRGMKRVLAEI